MGKSGVANFHQVGEVCQLTGLTPRTLHYYDEIGLLVPSERLAGGQRLYSAADLRRIVEIKELKRLLGLSLSNIKHLLDADDARTRHLDAAEKAADAAARRRELERALAITEAQWRSVQDKVTQLTAFKRKLERQVRDLRRLAAAPVRGNGVIVRAGAPR
ncbi:MAG TPA: MerR family transcriptional regulator [bacterium]|nr:MerR family transcriptional regulator [bacterium]